MEKVIYLTIDGKRKAKIIVSEKTTVKKLLKSASPFLKNVEYVVNLKLDGKNQVTNDVLMNKDYENSLVYDIIKDGDLVYNRKTKNQILNLTSLKKAGYSDVEEWLKNPNHVYIGQRKKVNIKNSEFIIPESKWKNFYPIEVGMSKEESERLYRLYLVENNRIPFLKDIRGKTLGCFCTGQNCHFHILQELCDK